MLYVLYSIIRAILLFMCDIYLKYIKILFFLIDCLFLNKLHSPAGCHACPFSWAYACQSLTPEYLPVYQESTQVLHLFIVIFSNLYIYTGKFKAKQEDHTVKKESRQALKRIHSSS